MDINPTTPDLSSSPGCPSAATLLCSNTIMGAVFFRKDCGQNMYIINVSTLEFFFYFLLAHVV